MLPQSSLMNAAAGDSLPSGAMPDVVASEEHGAVSSHRGDGVDANATIMIVDDSRINVEIVENLLREAGYRDFVTTNDPRYSMDLIRKRQPDVIILDVMMPHISGLHVLEAIRNDIRLHHLPVLVLTASTDEETRLESLELGATDFLTKPVRPTELIPRMRNALILKSHHDHLVENSVRLEQQVRLRTAELVQSRQEVIQVLARAAEFRDQDTGNHVLRVGRYSGIIARQLGFSMARVELIQQAAILHDVGKIGIPDAILLKSGELDRTASAMMQQHCEYGAKILRGMTNRVGGGAHTTVCQSPILQMAATIAMTHHERWDGTGYPRGLSGEAIPLEGRIAAVADEFDVLGADRPQKPAVPLECCFEIVEEGRGTQFDPLVLDAFAARNGEVVQVAMELRN